MGENPKEQLSNPDQVIGCDCGFIQGQCAEIGYEGIIGVTDPATLGDK